jgi:hypothetical protein
MIYGMEFKLAWVFWNFTWLQSVKMNENEFFYIQNFHNLYKSQLVFLVGRTYILFWSMSYFASFYICILVGTRDLRTLWSPSVFLNQERHTNRRKTTIFIFILFIFCDENSLKSPPWKHTWWSEHFGKFSKK